ncbi:hypothetical protein HYV73_00610 [Candidatus Uhrbacteria bacterium]|nr:hypothetical protein [Candidatus Uhrbacteria bacterium]
MILNAILTNRLATFWVMALKICMGFVDRRNQKTTALTLNHFGVSEVVQHFIFLSSSIQNFLNLIKELFADDGVLITFVESRLRSPLLFPPQHSVIKRISKHYIKHALANRVAARICHATLSHVFAQCHR